MTEAQKVKNLKRIAKIFTIHGYRNSPIEDIHASGRISDAEMKHLNKTIYNQIYTLVTAVDRGQINWYLADPSWGSDWDEPELIKEMLQ